ncbi:MAG: T9SS type A sorting domain-containing protein [Candidatus Eisenbacteria bacterium]|nr:T9SS type A sorting domain-containing protein [Candidatus Eisenbacteria bacterium]
MRRLKWLLVPALCAMLLPLCLRASPGGDEGGPPLRSDNHAVRSFVIGAAGGPAASAEFQVHATTGQPAVGPSTAADLRLSGGFWTAWLAWISDATDPPTRALCTVLHRNRPNPFRDQTVISYSLAEGGPLAITIIDITGRVIRTLADGQGVPGQHSTIWDGRDDAGSEVSSGVYFCRLQAESQVSLNKLIILD